MIRYILELLSVLLLTFSSIRAQVPNGSFEIWTSEINPDYWAVTISPEFEVIVKTSDSHSGQWAVKGLSVPYSSTDSTIVRPSMICLGNNASGFPIKNRYNSIKGFYKLIPKGVDHIDIVINLFLDTLNIGWGHLELDSASSYTEFNVPIQYYSASTPNYCWIDISLSTSEIGSEMYIDDVELSMDNAGISDVQGPVQSFSYKLDQNYPNPFNPSTTIKYTVTQSSNVVLKIYDVLGKEVATLINEEKPAGNYEVEFNASNLSSGIYFYRLRSGNFVETKKMILQK